MALAPASGLPAQRAAILEGGASSGKEVLDGWGWLLLVAGEGYG